MRGILPGSAPDDQKAEKGGILPGSVPQKAVPKGAAPVPDRAREEEPAGRSRNNPSESELLLDRKYSCPVCGSHFTAPAVKAGKAMLEKRDMDLCNRYKNIDPLKYRVVECPGCGYAALDNDFEHISKRETASLRDQLNARSQQMPLSGVRTYEEAFRLYRAALRIALMKGGKKSERAGIALHTAWLLRTRRDSPEGAESGKDYAGEEQNYLKYALQHFLMARTEESYPIRNMNEAGLDYLLAALSYETGEKKEAEKFTSWVLQNRECSRGIRIMAEDLWDLLHQERRLNGD